jgi:four helix bundle protein
MTDTKKAIQEKSLAFGKRAVKLRKHLNETMKEYELARQVLRSGTSIGANVTEAEFAISKKEFYYKMYIALKECAETQYWLELIHYGGYIQDKDYQSIKTDCDELKRILSAITKTVRESE